MADGMITVDGTNLIDIAKGLISKVTLEILTKRGLYTHSSHHSVKVFSNKTSVHGELLIRKEFLMSVLKESCNVAEPHQLKVVTDDIARDLNKLVITNEELSYYFAEIIHSSGHINIRLCRPHCFTVCIGEVTRSKNNYGTLPSTREHVYLFTHDSAHEVTGTEEHYCTEFHQLMNQPVSKARGVLMASLLYNLLTAAGITVTLLSTSHSYRETLFNSLFSSLPYTCEQSALGVHCIDVRKYLLERNLLGKGGYNSALNKVNVRNEMGLTEIGHKALDIIKAVPDGHTTSNTTIIHIVHCQGSHDIEKAIAVSLVATGIDIQHQILTHSGVKGDDKTELMFSQLLKNRELSSIEACKVRYGNTTSDAAKMKHVSSRVAEAAIKFDLLLVDPNCQVKCCLHDSVDLRSSGSFVLYNYARIATIMDKFEDAVRKGAYLPLPHVSDIDFSLLTDQSEWVLLFQYIATYPSKVVDASTLEKQGLGLYVTSGSKKLCVFLIHLSREFSSYYSRVKILLEPQPHLLPLMYARLTLVSCVKQVLYNGLKLLSIEPINQL